VHNINMNWKTISILFVLLFFISTAFSAPSVTITDIGSTTSGSIIPITFTIVGEDADVNNPDDLIIAYSTSAGSFTNTIYTDTNLIDGVGVTCDDYNFQVSSVCTYNWTVPSVTPFTYFVDANYIQHETGVGYTDSTSGFLIENTQGCGTLNLAVLIISLAMMLFALLKLLNDTNPTNMAIFAVSIIVGLAIIYTFMSSVCVVTG